MARPLLKIDEKQVTLLAGCFCTNEEIAVKLGCSADTLVRRFADAIEKGRTDAKHSLRSAQFKMAKTNPTMAIWLGKQYLGQREPDKLTPIELDSAIERQLNALRSADSLNNTTPLIG